MRLTLALMIQAVGMATADISFDVPSGNSRPKPELQLT
jgi:hypothetical protein